MSTLFYVPQYFTTQLSVAGGIDDTQTTGIVLQDISGVDATKPGIIALTWSNPIDTTKIEYLFYTSINDSTNELVGVTRGQEGYSAKSHLNGATVAWPLSKSHINNLNDNATIHSGDDGWTVAGETWTYASANTITVPSGAASKYSKGDKIRLKQGAGYKYYYIIGVADTVLTVTGGSDFTVANDTITDNYYSHQANPIGFPSSFEYTPTQVGFSTTMSTLKAYFHINGRMVYVTFARGINDGVSNATNLTLSLPVTAENKSNYIYNGFCTAVDNNSVLTSPSVWLVLAGATVCTFEKATGSANWTNSGSKAILNASVYYNI